MPALDGETVALQQTFERAAREVKEVARNVEMKPFATECPGLQPSRFGTAITSTPSLVSCSRAAATTAAGLRKCSSVCHIVRASNGPAVARIFERIVDIDAGLLESSAAPPISVPDGPNGRRGSAEEAAVAAADVAQCSRAPRGVLEDARRRAVQ